MRVLSIGEILWDVFPQRELLGGAALNFSANLARLGDEAELITSVGDDERGRLALERARELGVRTPHAQVSRMAGTGTAVVSTGADGEPRFEIVRPAAYDYVEVTDECLEQLRFAPPDWLYYGSLLGSRTPGEQAVGKLVEGLGTARVFLDINLRAGHWDYALVERLAGTATILKLNEDEARILAECSGSASPFSLELFCCEWARRFGLQVICVTLGPAGCLIYEQGVSTQIAGFAVHMRDTVGAGDAFSAGFLHAFHAGSSAPEAARFGNALGALVAAGEGATPGWTRAEWLELVESGGKA